MDLYHTTDIDGITELNPPAAKLRALLKSLDSPGAASVDHPDVALVHDPSGWSISVYPSGVVTLENLEDEDADPLYMNKVSRNQAFELWQTLSLGRIEQLRQQPWQRASEAGP
jgi:hypothetical protein